MIKKGISIFFILLANLVLLAHIIVPHHHHSEELCIENTICHSNNHQHHQHPSGSNTDCCILKESVGIPSHNFKSDSKWIIKIKNNYFYGDLFNSTDSLMVSNFYCTLNYYLFYHTNFLINDYQRCSIGLRAPPFV